MILALVCSHALILASSEASPTQRPSSKNFDESLDEFTAIETNRTTLIKKAVAMASDLKSNETLRFLEVVEQANEVLVNIRRYFDAGRVMFDVNEGKSNLTETEVIAKTQLLQEEKFMNIQMHKLRAIYKTMYAQMEDVPKEELNMLLRPVIDALTQSDQALTPLGQSFQIELDKVEKTSI
nr:PREDICTED: uncharacterized protein LOC109041866 isoform X2 [Bemisia tabaci]